jgi:hemerythrin-like metal-binding protein
MNLIEWDDSQFSVLVDEMDEQHKRWIDLINALHASLLGKGKRIDSAMILTEMLAYTRFHFKEEEELMRNIKYPGYIEHKREHDTFIARLNKMEKDIEAGNVVLGTQLMSILKNWLENHIARMDKKYGEFASQTKS